MKIEKIPKKVISISIDLGVLYEVDSRRGLISRSGFIGDLIQTALGIKEEVYDAAYC